MKIKNTIGLLSELIVAVGISVCIVFPYNADVVASASVVSFLAFLTNRYYTYSINVKLQALNIAEAAERSLLRSIRRSVSDGSVVLMDTLGASFEVSKDAETKYHEVYGFHRPEFGISKAVFCGADWSKMKDMDGTNDSKLSS